MCRFAAIMLLLGSFLCPLGANATGGGLLLGQSSWNDAAPLGAVIAAICTAIFGYLTAWMQLRYGERADLRSALEAKDAKLDAKLEAHFEALRKQVETERVRNEEQGRALLEALRDKDQAIAERRLLEIELSQTPEGSKYLARLRASRPKKKAIRAFFRDENSSDELPVSSGAAQSERG